MNLNFRKIKVLADKENRAENYEEIIIQPLEKGYGLTIGVALRRILLNSMPGCAIIGFKIDGVTHELMEIPGSSTDTLQLISALKSLRFKMDGEDDVLLTLKVDKAGQYYSRDLILPDGVSLLTEDVNLLNGNGEKEFEVQLLLRKGRSDTQAREHRDVDQDFIQIDGLFSPIKNVGYEVSPLLVEEEVSHETLVLKITSDGSIDGMEAVSIAAKIAKEHFAKFDEMEEKKTELEIFKEKEIERISIDNTTIEELNLSVRSTNALRNAGIKNVGDLRKVTETELSDFRNMGETSVNEVKRVLDKMGVQLGDY